MRTTPDSDGNRPRRHRHRRHGLGWHGWHGWHRWLLYPLIAVSAYLLVALAKAVPPPAAPYAAHTGAAAGVPAPAR